MRKRPRKMPTRPKDANQLAKAIVDQAVGGSAGDEIGGELDTLAGKNPAAVALGRLGGLKGGKARAKKLSKRRRQQIARKAAQSRWSKSE